MEKITLPRTGNRPLQFTGEQIASASTRQMQGAGENRWWDLTLYRADSGRYAVQIEYNSQWQGEQAHSAALIADTAADIVRRLAEYGWRSRIHGYPRGQDDRQRDLLQRLGDCWDVAVGELLADVEPETL
jgi:hypothetical protein